MNKNLYDLILLISLFLISSTNTAKLRTRSTTLSESAAKALVEKYQPVVYLHKDEDYFPTKIEDLDIDWSKASLENKDTYVSYTFKGPSSFDSSAPIYTSVYETTSDNTVRISYVFFFAYNGCGPKARIYAKLVGLGVDKSPSVCPADVHWGDIEHIEVTLSRSNSNSDYSTLSKIKYAYHQWSKTYTSDGTEDGKISDNVTFESGTHPVVYVANGSHASYSSSGDQQYKKVFYEKGTGYKTYLYLVDYCASSPSNGYRWYGTAKLLKLNGNAVTGISAQEKYLGFTYYGRIGEQIDSEKVDHITSVLDKVKSVAKSLSIKSIVNGIKKAEEELETYFEATGVTGLANPSRSWW